MIGYMFGGTFAYTSDSRYSSDLGSRPIPIMIETQQQ